MRIELLISMISFLVSAVIIHFISLKRTLVHTSRTEIFISGIFSWIFLLSTAGWMLLFGDTLAAWITFPENEQLFSILISAVVVLCIYLLSIRPNAPYSGITALNFALASLSFQSADSVPTNKLMLFLKKRAFNQFLEEVQPDIQDHTTQQRENLIDHLHHRQITTDGLKQLENGIEVTIIDADKPFPTILSQHPFFKYLKRLTINTLERKAHLQLVNLEALDGTQLDADARILFLRQVYDFIQAISHEPFLRPYGRFFDTLSLALFRFLTVDGRKKSEEPIFLFEISTAVLQKIESTYINPSKLITIATVQFRSTDTHIHSTE